MTDLWQLGARALERRFASGQASPSEALDSVLERIARLDGQIGAFTCVLEEESRRRASELTEESAHGHSRGPLHGVPVAVKELFDVRGVPGDYGSNTLAGRVADADAQLVRRLRHAGAVIVGTTRSHEFGWGMTTQHSERGGTRNPWNRDRVPGGSSGGSAAAVAAGMVPLAVGSDTAGSIRVPACFCGVAGLKPTFGRIGRSGGVALAPSLDTAGALARSIDDAALLVAAMSGPDRNDPACVSAHLRAGSRSDLLRSDASAGPFDADRRRGLSGSLEGVRIATSQALLGIDLDAGLARVYDRALDALAQLGADLVEIDLPSASSIFESFMLLQMAEAHHVHSRILNLFPERAGDYGEDVRSRLEAAMRVSVGDYLSAQQDRLRIRAAFEHRLSSVDALVSPISPVGPSRIDNREEASHNGRPRPMREAVLPFTVPQNMAGLPVAIVRAGFDPEGLPVGVQLTASAWREETVVTLAAALQAALGPIGIAPEPPEPPLASMNGPSPNTAPGKQQ